MPRTDAISPKLKNSFVSNKKQDHIYLNNILFPAYAKHIYSS